MPIHKPFFFNHFIFRSLSALWPVRDEGRKPPPLGAVMCLSSGGAPEDHPNISASSPLFLRARIPGGARIVRTRVFGGAGVLGCTWILRCTGVFRCSRIPGRGRILRSARILRRTRVVGHAWVFGRRGVLGVEVIPAGILRRGGVGSAGVCASACGLYRPHERLALRLPREHALIPRGRERNHVGFEVPVRLQVEFARPTLLVPCWLPPE